MDKPEKRYRPDTTKYRLMTEDWSHCTKKQIADALFTTVSNVRAGMSIVKRDTGYVVPHLIMPPSRQEKPDPPDPGKCVHVVLPPSYQSKKPQKTPRKCSTCGNTECASRHRAICWTKCQQWIPCEETEVEP